jgi:hypothetical protein
VGGGVDVGWVVGLSLHPLVPTQHPHHPTFLFLTLLSFGIFTFGVIQVIHIPARENDKILILF